ncbi:hypothetical protein DEU56DRAFT_787565 [Suillus clintonianus]|uniref:uncharacterized protein n=1 Tax=Suillus clintonianus TaxID=1904413 RepID=UPI001B8797D1|nr:uncharacterized protein DEU56DRAFT_787565 [Suillus clintonianus]KAG2146340.1 hypothetical protein DEU56DRAFT_787565 [Suillus clintonianus]
MQWIPKTTPSLLRCLTKIFLGALSLLILQMFTIASGWSLLTLTTTTLSSHRTPGPSPLLAPTPTPAPDTTIHQNRTNL